MTAEIIYLRPFHRSANGAPAPGHKPSAPGAQVSAGEGLGTDRSKTMTDEDRAFLRWVFADICDDYRFSTNDDDGDPPPAA